MSNSNRFYFLSFLFMIGVFLVFFLFTYSGVLKKVYTTQNILYLTFDDGPGPYTDQVLDILAEHNVSATFFLLGERVNEYPNLIKRMVNESHVIGSHSYSHQVLLFNVAKEIISSNQAIESITNKPVKLFRAPYGIVFPHTVDIAHQLGLRVISWSCFPRDYTASYDEVVYRTTRCFKPGEIIVLHPWNHPQTVKALPEIIKSAHERGFRFAVLN